MGGQEWDEKIFQEGQKGLAANKKKPDISAWLVVAGTGLMNMVDYQYVIHLWGQNGGQKIGILGI